MNYEKKIGMLMQIRHNEGNARNCLTDKDVIEEAVTKFVLADINSWLKVINPKRWHVCSFESEEDSDLYFKPFTTISSNKNEKN